MGGDYEPVFIARDVQHDNDAPALDLDEVRMRIGTSEIDDVFPSGRYAALAKRFEPVARLGEPRRRQFKERLGNDSNGYSVCTFEKKSIDFKKYRPTFPHPPPR